MKLYVAITGLIFLIIFLSHIARLFFEGLGALSQPVFLTTSILSAAIAAWAVILWPRLPAAWRA